MRPVTTSGACPADYPIPPDRASSIAGSLMWTGGRPDGRSCLKPAGCDVSGQRSGCVVCDDAGMPNEPGQERPLDPATVAVVAGRPSATGEPLNQPIVLASNVRGSGEYSRTDGTATWSALETAIGLLEGGRALAFSSGMAAAAAAIYALAPRVVVVPEVSYLGVRSLLGEYERQGSIELRRVDVTDTEAVFTAAEGADVVWVETPTNPTLDVADLPAIGQRVGAAGVRMVVDSTFATPLRQQPLAHGAAIVVHSATKFIGGHSDLLLGLCVTADDDIHERLFQARTFQGATPARSKRSSRCAGCGPCRSGWRRRNATQLSSSNGFASIPPSMTFATPAAGRWSRSCALVVLSPPTRCASRSACSCPPPASAAWRRPSSVARNTPVMPTSIPACCE